MKTAPLITSTFLLGMLFGMATDPPWGARGQGLLLNKEDAYYLTDDDNHAYQMKGDFILIPCIAGPPKSSALNNLKLKYLDSYCNEKAVFFERTKERYQCENGSLRLPRSEFKSKTVDDSSRFSLPDLSRLTSMYRDCERLRSSKGKDSETEALNFLEFLKINLDTYLQRRHMKMASVPK